MIDLTLLAALSLICLILGMIYGKLMTIERKLELKGEPEE
jgi:hypothetical protein